MVGPDDVWAFALEQSLFGQQVINTFALRILATPVALSEGLFMDHMWGTPDVGFNEANNILEAFKTLQTPQVRYVAWHARRVVGELTNIFTFPISDGGESIFGSRVGDCETANLAMSIERKGLQPGRRSRGRIAVAGIPVTNIASGKWDGTVLVSGSSLSGDIAGVKVSAQEVTFEMGFWSPEHEQKDKNGVITILPQQFTYAISSTPKDTVRVQRSRTVGVGT